MQFNHVEIGEKILPETMEEGYYVTINYMYGDADGYSDETWGPFYKGEEKSLLKFVNMLERTLKAFPHGRGGCDSYEDKIPELREWIEGRDENEKYFDKEHIINGVKYQVPEVRLDFSWGSVPTYDDYDATITGYNVQYYDVLSNSYYKVLLSKREKARGN